MCVYVFATVCVVSSLGSSTLLGFFVWQSELSKKKKVQQQLQLASSCPLDASLAAGKGEQTELKLIAFIGSLLALLLLLLPVAKFICAFYEP